MWVESGLTNPQIEQLSLKFPYLGLLILGPTYSISKLVMCEYGSRKISD